MNVQSKNKNQAVQGALLAGVMIVLPSLSWACCPDDGQGAPKAVTGLGTSLPSSIDLAPDPAWQVFEFERDGIRYVQINDATGKVRAAAGRIGGTFWVMPIGSDVDRVSVPGSAMLSGRLRVLYRASDVEVVLIESSGASRWLIRAPASD